MASKKLKKFLKKAGMAAAAVGALGALRNRSAAANRIKGMIENDSFANARKLMTSNAAMRGLPKGGVTIPMNPQMLSDELMMLNEGTDFGLGPMDGAKSGGRITKSGVKRKVSKFAKKKKQANRSKKK